MKCQNCGKKTRTIDTRQYVELLAAAIAKTDEIVIFEGFMTDAQCTAITNILKGKAIVWDMQRSE